jgi:hypothetical protein
MRQSIRIWVLGVFAAGGLGAGVAAVFHYIPTVKQRQKNHFAVTDILNGLGNYSDMRRRLPPLTITDSHGKPLSSWRFTTSMIMVSGSMHRGYYTQYPQLDKPWNSLENQPYASGPHHEYPGSPPTYIDQTRPGNKARFVAVAGPETGFHQKTQMPAEQLPRALLLITEVRDCTTHWMEPGGDLDVTTVPQTIGAEGGIGPASTAATEFYVGFADMSVWLLRTDVPFENLAKFFTISSAKQNNRDALLGPFAVKVWKKS